VTVSPQASAPPPELEETYSLRTTVYERIGGFAVPLAATVLAFFVGGLVVLITGHNPITAYRAIFEGAGFNWPWQWLTGQDTTASGRDLQQTLRAATPLILAALAVAFSFRCGLFNIGGQGQYWVGFIFALIAGTHLEGLSRPLHVALCILAGIVGGAFWGGIAGFLRATVGAHEVITTIMLNWIAIYVGKWLFELDGPLQGAAPSLPRSEVIFDSATLWILWKPYLHIGLLIAIVALLIYFVLLNRTTLGYEVRAVGFNAEAARYSGISVRWNYFLALAISGAFAGLAGTVDLLGVKHAVDQSDFDTNFVAFTAIAVALLGRNKPVGIFFAGLLFAGLSVGTSSRNLDPEVFEPALATDLATMIQALVIFFVGADLLIIYIWRLRRHLKLKRPQPPAEEPATS
jgi:general nucleoside transport system permease protein